VAAVAPPAAVQQRVAPAAAVQMEGDGTDSAPELVTPTAEDTLTSDSYKAFKTNLQTHAKKVGVSDAECENVWKAIVTKLIASQEQFKKIPLADKARGFIQLSSTAYQELAADVSTVAGALSKYMDEDTKNKKIWAFWSGAGAKEAAKGSGLAEVYLEGTAFGAPFEGVKEFVSGNPALNIVVWGAFSSAYAQKAAESLEGRSFLGFVGPGADRTESVFMQVEQPTFEDLCKQKHGLTQAPPITWYGVAINEDWKWDAEYAGNPKGFVLSGGDRGACAAAAKEHSDSVQKAKAEREAAALNAH
jgi:hypothetical protein